MAIWNICNAKKKHQHQQFISQYSVDIRDRDFKAAKRWSDEMVFANRAYFLFEKQPGELAVQNAKESDSGIYRCRVDFKVAQTRNSKVNLTVIRKYQSNTHLKLLIKSFVFVSRALFDLVFDARCLCNQTLSTKYRSQLISVQRTNISKAK